MTCTPACSPPPCPFSRSPCRSAEPFAAQDWRLRQELPVPSAGLVQLALPVETLDAARADLADLRLIDPAGQEVAYALEQGRPVESVIRVPKLPTSTVEDAAMVFVLETGMDDFITALQIDAGHRPVHPPLPGCGLVSRQGMACGGVKAIALFRIPHRSTVVKPLILTPAGAGAKIRPRAAALTQERRTTNAPDRQVSQLPGEERRFDLHLRTGSPPIVRIDGALQKMKLPPLTGDQLKEPDGRRSSRRRTARSGRPSTTATSPTS